MTRRSLKSECLDQILLFLYALVHLTRHKVLIGTLSRSKIFSLFSEQSKGILSWCFINLNLDRVLGSCGILQLQEKKRYNKESMIWLVIAKSGYQSNPSGPLLQSEAPSWRSLSRGWCSYKTLNLYKLSLSTWHLVKVL